MFQGVSTETFTCQCLCLLWCYPPFSVCANNIPCCWLCSWTHLCWGSANDGLECKLHPQQMYSPKADCQQVTSQHEQGHSVAPMADLCSVLCVPAVVPWSYSRPFELSLHSQIKSFLWFLSTEPKFQYPASACTSRHTSPTEKCSNVAHISTDPSLLYLIASQNLYSPFEQTPGHSHTLSVLKDFRDWGL